ncbi:hypothetical protein HZP46_07260 [Elizabethkingia anophelis]|nr:hypothetical protein [Elizabethkingia anophelis]
MKLRKVKLTVYDSKGETEIIRTELNVELISVKIKIKINNLINFVKITQKGERKYHSQIRKFSSRYSNENTDEKYNPKFHLYLYAIEFTIYELNRMIEVYHQEFLAQINEDYQIDLLHSPNFKQIQKSFKAGGIELSKIDKYKSVDELRRICNGLKHSYIQEYSLSKTLKLKSFREFDRKVLINKVNTYLIDIPKYIEELARMINKVYPKIEIRK